MIPRGLGAYRSSAAAASGAGAVALDGTVDDCDDDAAAATTEGRLAEVAGAEDEGSGGTYADCCNAGAAMAPLQLALLLLLFTVAAVMLLLDRISAAPLDIGIDDLDK